MISILTIKTDSGTKEQLKVLAEEFGVSITALVNMLIKQTIRDRRVVLSVHLEPTAYLEKVMREVDEDIKTGKNLSKAYSSVDDFFSDLDKSA